MLCPLFAFTDTATPEIYTLSLHDALPIFAEHPVEAGVDQAAQREIGVAARVARLELDVGGLLLAARARSEEHTSELQSLRHLVCRLLLEKKKKTKHLHTDVAMLTEHTLVI